VVCRYVSAIRERPFRNESREIRRSQRRSERTWKGLRTSDEYSLRIEGARVGRATIGDLAMKNFVAHVDGVIQSIAELSVL